MALSKTNLHATHSGLHAGGRVIDIWAVGDAHPGDAVAYFAENYNMEDPSNRVEVPGVTDIPSGQIIIDLPKRGTATVLSQDGALGEDFKGNYMLVQGDENAINYIITDATHAGSQGDYEKVDITFVEKLN